MKPNIGLSDVSQNSVVKILNKTLSDEYVLYTKTRNFHWNVMGPQFNDLHKFFEAQYEALNEIIDDVAERARSIGGFSFGTLSEFSKTTDLKETPGKHPSATGMIQALLKDHELVIKNLRKDLKSCDEAYSDMGTSDFLTGLMEKHEKMAWMLRSFLG